MLCYKCYKCYITFVTYFSDFTNVGTTVFVHPKSKVYIFYLKKISQIQIKILYIITIQKHVFDPKKSILISKDGVVSRTSQR